MSTKNTSEDPEVKLATGEQIEHVMDMWRRRLKGRKLTLQEANVIIRNGNRYLTVMDKAADVLVDQVRWDIQNTTVRIVSNIRRNRSVEQAINDTGRKRCTTDSVITTMPVVEGPEKVELTYRRLSRYMTAKELKQFMDGYKIDPQAQAADNEADPSFADTHPNISHWEQDGKVFCLAFSGWYNERVVRCYPHVGKFNGYWWVCGVRK